MRRGQCRLDLLRQFDAHLFPNGARPVDRSHNDVQGQHVWGPPGGRREMGQRADRGGAPGPQMGQHGSLGGGRQSRAVVVDSGEGLGELAVMHIGGPTLDGQGSLGRSRQHDRRVEKLGDDVTVTQTSKP